MAHKQSYPYPILGEGDDVEGIFNPSFWVTLRPMLVEAEFTFHLQNATLEKLIAQRKAEYVVEMECKTTFFRQTFKTASAKNSISLPAERLREKVDVSFYICAAQKIPEYRPSGLHRDYGNISFPIEPGDVLAEGGRGYFIAEKTFDPMRAPLSSFMRIERDKKKAGPVVVDFEGDYLLIKLSEEDHDRFQEAKHRAIQSLHSIIVLPALIETLRCIGNPEKKMEYEDKKWYGRLEAICREQKIDLEDPFVAAQKILGNPISRGLDEVLELSPGENGDE